MTEPLLTETLDRFVLYPIKHDKVWEMYKNAVASIWFSEEIDLQDDINDWAKLTDNERHFISYVLAFFATADGIVNENLALRFYNEVQIPEAKQFYGFQIFMEGIHAETYALLLDTLIKDQEEKDKLFHAITTIPCIAKKANWALRWINNSDSFAERIVSFSIVEGLLFCGAFCAINWLKSRGLMSGLGFSNELISRDESLHCDFACLLYSMLQHKLPAERVYDIMEEAVQIEKEFIIEAIPVSLLGMNSTLMSQYIEFMADRLLYALGYDKLYKVENPFMFMNVQSLQGKTNFFEKHVPDYQKQGISMASKKGESANSKFTIDADF